jgi:hypothetical protein
MDRLTRPDLDPRNLEALRAWHSDIRAAAAALTEAARNAPLNDEQLAYASELAEWSREVGGLITTNIASADSHAAALDALAGIAATDHSGTGGDDADGDNGSDSGEGDNGSGTTTPPEGDGGLDDATVNATAARLLEFLTNAAGQRGPGLDNGGGGGSAPSVADLLGTGPDADADGAGDDEDAPMPAMIAANDIGGGYTGGQVLADRRQLAGAVAARIKGYGIDRGTSRGAAIRQPSKQIPTTRLAAAQLSSVGGRFGATGRSAVMKSPSRHNAATIQRQITEQQFTGDAEQNWMVAQGAALEWADRLRAGREHVLTRPSRRRGLIASYCAPSLPEYNLCRRSSMDGALPLPERTVDRGGIIHVAGGGLDFGSVYDLLGDNTMTEAEANAGVVKTCIEVPCLETENVRLNADWLCVTAGLLQRRAWPESIDAFIADALAAKFHKTNSRIIAAIAAASDYAGEVATCIEDDAFSAAIAAVEMAIDDLGARAYMEMGGEFEVVFPFWVRAQFRAALVRRRALEDPVKADAWIEQQFAKLNATVHFVYGWQDAHMSPNTEGLPGGATPIQQLATSAEFLVYPAGTWVKGAAEIIDLDTIYDSAQLPNNAYTALFVEDAWLALQTCPYSRRYTVELDPCSCGCVGLSSPTSPTSP